MNSKVSIKLDALLYGLGRPLYFDVGVKGPTVKEGINPKNHEAIAY